MRSPTYHEMFLPMNKIQNVLLNDGDFSRHLANFHYVASLRQV